MSAWRRFGGFLIALGVLLLALFALSDVARQPEWVFFVAGVVVIGLGILIRVANPAPAQQPSTRFRILKRRKDEPKPKQESRRQPAGEEEEEEEEGKTAPPPKGKPRRR